MIGDRRDQLVADLRTYITAFFIVTLVARILIALFITREGFQFSGEGSSPQRQVSGCSRRRELADGSVQIVDALGTAAGAVLASSRCFEIRELNRRPSLIREISPVSSPR